MGRAGAIGLMVLVLAAPAFAQEEMQIDPALHVPESNPVPTLRAEPDRPARFGLLTTHVQAHRHLPNTVSDVSVGILVQAPDLAKEEEVEAARDDLSSAASRTALMQATVVAKAVGQRVVGVARLDVGGQVSGIVRPIAKSAMAISSRSAPIPVEGGDTEVTADVSLVARIALQD